MQLNKSQKSRIVNDIMRDVPEVDHLELIREYVQEEALKLMPAEVRAVYDNPETRGFLACCGLHISGGYYLGSPRAIFWGHGSQVPSSYGNTLYLNKRHWNKGEDDLTKRLLNTVHDKVALLVKQAEEQRKVRELMKDKLRTMLAGIRTLKQAKTMLEPELHKYLPAEPPKTDPKAAQASTALVPYVVANLREMGWPKDQEPTTGEAA